MTVDAPTGPVRRPAVSVCVFRGADVLLVLRGRPPKRGLWAPVGGKVEPGETREAAALRETLEETGVVCRLIGVSGRREIAAVDPDGTPFVHDMVVFAAAWISGEPVAGDDAAAARFVAPDDLAAFDLVDGAAPHIAAARRLHDGSTAPDAVRKGRGTDSVAD